MRPRKYSATKTIHWTIIRKSAGDSNKPISPLYALDYGKVLCVVDLVDCVPTGKLRGRIGPWEFWGDFRDKGDDGKDRYAFQLENVRLIPVLKRPAVTGRQGFFNVPENIITFE